MHQRDVIDEVVAAEEELERSEAEVPVDESTEDPSLEESTATEREGLDREVDEATAERASPPADLVDVRELRGIPLHYERIATPGPRSFPVSRSFVRILEAIVQQTQQRAPARFGELRQITSGGMFVAKPGAHGRGRACDWDRLVFANVRISPLDRDHASGSPAKRMRYWAFGAIARSNCAYVLHGLYDKAHEDHFHTDNMTGIGFNRGSEATVKLVQAVLNEIHGATPRLATDGDYGSKSQTAFARALEEMQLGGSIDQLPTWRKFLRRSGRLGFQRSLGA